MRLSESAMVGLALLGAACGAGPGGDGVDRGQGSGGASVGGDVVSTVNGRPIRVEDVRRVVTRTDLGPRQAVRRLQEQMLLSAEARRRGYRNRRAVQRARDRAAVQALLERVVERKAQTVEGRRRRLDRVLTRLEGRYEVRRRQAAIDEALRRSMGELKGKP
jgi:hypothetical protein